MPRMLAAMMSKCSAGRQSAEPRAPAMSQETRAVERLRITAAVPRIALGVVISATRYLGMGCWVLERAMCWAMCLDGVLVSFFGV